MKAAAGWGVVLAVVWLVVLLLVTMVLAVLADFGVVSPYAPRWWGALLLPPVFGVVIAGPLFVWLDWRGGS